MEQKNDNIYIYIWEEFNTVYIGRTKNPQKRHYQHRNRECDKTYKFSTDHHVEHPPMIILENDLSIEEGVEREKYWIKYYREHTSYNVLNKTCGGQKGRLISTNSIDEKERRRKYYQDNKEKILAYRKLYRETHRKEINEYNRKHYIKRSNDRVIKSKEEILEYRRLYRESHREEIRIKAKLYRETHKDKVKEYYDKNKEKIRESRKDRMKLYYQKNKEKIRLQQKEYRKKKNEEKV